MSDDYYAILGVERHATHAEIKKRYRDIARQYHPDKNPGDHQAEAIFKDAAEAYRVLGDADLREHYDRTGPATRSGDVPRSTATTNDVANETFENIFGGSPRAHDRAAPRAPSRTSTRTRGSDVRGNDLRYSIELDFEEAALGALRNITLPQRDGCSMCGGTGARPGSSPVICKDCGGAGTRKVRRGYFDVAERCERCDGAGRRITEPCARCKGRGFLRVDRTIAVRIPPGVDAKTRLKLSGEGEAGADGAPTGDLFVVVGIRAHPLFAREEQDVVVEVPVSMVDAALGREIEIPTLEGTSTIVLPAGTQSGQVLRLEGMGIPSIDGRRRGDLRVRVVVEIPTKLSARAKDLLEKAADALGPDGDSAKAREFRAALAKRRRGD